MPFDTFFSRRSYFGDAKSKSKKDNGYNQSFSEKEVIKGGLINSIYSWWQGIASTENSKDLEEELKPDSSYASKFYYD